MNVGTRHLRAPGRAPSAFVLMSLIALALACFPVLAHAEDSSGVQYSDAIPKAEGENTPTHHQQTPAKSSSTDNGGGTAPSHGSNPQSSTEADGSGESESSSNEGGVAAAKHDGGGTGQGNPGGSANDGAKKALHPAGQKASPVTPSDDDGSSSPLVPILIAIAALAAISVAVVMIRQRRQRGPAATASPEAN